MILESYLLGRAELVLIAIDAIESLSLRSVARVEFQIRAPAFCESRSLTSSTDVAVLNVVRRGTGRSGRISRADILAVLHFRGASSGLSITSRALRAE